MKKAKKPGLALPTNDKAALVASWLEEKKAEDILALDVAGLCPITECLVICSAKNARQAKALADHVLQKCGELGLTCLGMEGFKTGQWILLDLNDVLAHIFLDEFRRFYNLEGLWAEGKRLPLAPALAAKEGA